MKPIKHPKMILTRKKPIKQEFKFDLYPTKEQIEIIKINVNNVCTIWNYFVNISKNRYIHNKELRTHIKKLPVNQTYSQSLQLVAIDFERQLRYSQKRGSLPKIGWIIYDGADIHKLSNSEGYLFLIVDPLEPYDMGAYRNIEEYKYCYCRLLCDGLYGNKIDFSERIWIKNYRELLYNMNLKNEHKKQRETHAKFS